MYTDRLTGWQKGSKIVQHQWFNCNIMKCVKQYSSRWSRNYYWKQLCFLIFLWKPWYVFRIIWWMESSKELLLFKKEFLCNIRNVFTVIFYQFNISSLNSESSFTFIIIIIFKNQTHPKRLNVSSGIMHWSFPWLSYHFKHLYTLCLQSLHSLPNVAQLFFLFLTHFFYLS